MTLAEINALKAPVVSLTGADMLTVINSLFAHPGKAKLFAQQYQSFTGTIENGKRIWAFNLGMPNPGGSEWQFDKPADAPDRIESERDDTASLSNARTR